MVGSAQRGANLLSERYICKTERYYIFSVTLDSGTVGSNLQRVLILTIQQCNITKQFGYLLEEVKGSTRPF